MAKFADREREDGSGATTRHYTARSRDARNWKVTEDPSTTDPQRPPSSKKTTALLLKLNAGTIASSPRFRYYDPAADGPVNIQQLRLRIGLDRAELFALHWR